MKHLRHSSSLFFMTSLLLVLVLAACGGGNSAAAIPTLTQIPTYSFLTPTPFAAIETSVATTAQATAGLDQEIVTRGKTRYDALCATCHGENGEGTDKAKALTSVSMEEGAFTSFMRSGGTIGSTHQFASNRLSQTGGAALYQYLLSIRKSS